MGREHGTTLATDRNDRRQPRMRNPAVILPEAGPGIQALVSAVQKAGVSRKTRSRDVLWIALTNVFNRLNVSTRRVAGAWG